MGATTRNVKRTFDEIVADSNPAFDQLGAFTLKKSNEHITCEDGAWLSVQANALTYCTPRSDCGPYSHVEVGFPSVRPPNSWMEYCGDWDNPTGTVYAYVPVELVREFIDLHGGEVQADD